MADLYSDRISGIFGQPRPAAYPQATKQDKLLAKTVDVVEEQTLSAHAGDVTLLKELIEHRKILKKMNDNLKLIAQAGGADPVSSLMDMFDGKGGRGRAGRAGRAAGRGGRAGRLLRGAGSVLGGEAAVDVVRATSGSVTNFAKSFIGKVGTLANSSVSQTVRGGSRAITGAISVMSKSFMNTLMSSTSGIFKTLSGFTRGALDVGKGFISKLAVPVTAMFAAWDAWNGFQGADKLLDKLDPSTFEKSLSGAAQAASGILFGIPDMVTQKLFGMNASKFVDVGFGNASKGAINSITDTLFGTKAFDPVANAGSAPKDPKEAAAASMNVLTLIQATLFSTKLLTTQGKDQTKILKDQGEAIIGASNKSKYASEKSTGIMAKLAKAFDAVLAWLGLGSTGAADSAAATATGSEAGAAIGSMPAKIATGEAGGQVITGEDGSVTVVPKKTGGALLSPDLSKEVQLGSNPGAAGIGATSALKNSKGRVISTADTSMPAYKRALLDTVAAGEAPDYNTIVGGQKFSDMSKHPEVMVNGSSAAGRYQFVKSTWNGKKGKPGLKDQYNAANPNDPVNDFSPKSQDKVAYFLAQQDYKRRTGRNLDSDLKTGNYEHLVEGLGGQGADTTWQSLQGKSPDNIAKIMQDNVNRNNQYAKLDGLQNAFDSATKTDRGLKGGFGPAGAGAVGAAKVKMTNQDATRNRAVNQDLIDKIQDRVTRVYGAGYTAEIYSGGQDEKGKGNRRTGSDRHDDHGDGSLAGDVYIKDPRGNIVKGEELAKMGQDWQANKLGGVGMQMKGGGIHLDRHTEKAGKNWYYDDKGGDPTTKKMRQMIEDGKRGIGPDLALPNGIPGVDATKVDTSSINIGKNALDTVLGGTRQDQQTLGKNIGQGIIEAAPQQNVPALDDNKFNQRFGDIAPLDDNKFNSRFNSSTPNTPAVQNPVSDPKVSEIPHTDELQMLMANSSMMA